VANFLPSPQRAFRHHKFTTNSPQKHHKKHGLFPQPPSKNARKPRENRPTGASEFFMSCHEKITADNNKPVRNTDKDKAVVAADNPDRQDNAAVPAAAAVSPRPDGSTPPATPS
jgi:hypothetical protein